MEDYPFLLTATANVLTAKRQAAGLSKSALSVNAGIDRHYLLEIEQGKKRPTFNVIFLLCEALQITPSEFTAEIEAEIWRLKTAK